MQEEVLLESIGISKQFGHKKILDNIHFSLRRGEIVGLLGASGGGKSVFLKTLLGFLTPDKGIIQRRQHTKVGFSMQNNPLYDYLTVEQNLHYFSKINSMRTQERKEIIKELYQFLELAPYERVLVKNLSGGTKKRVDIACALLENPDVVILDEPFVGLDQTLVNQLSHFITLLNKHGKTIIITSHIIPELAKVCTRFVHLKEGKLEEIPRGHLSL